MDLDHVLVSRRGILTQRKDSDDGSYNHYDCNNGRANSASRLVVGHDGSLIELNVFLILGRRCAQRNTRSICSHGNNGAPETFSRLIIQTRVLRRSSRASSKTLAKGRRAASKFSHRHAVRKAVFLATSTSLSTSALSASQTSVLLCAQAPELGQAKNSGGELLGLASASFSTPLGECHALSDRLTAGPSS